MTEILAATCLALGFFLGWLLRTVLVMAEISRSQERMERKVRYWQSEAALARAIADHLRRLLAAAQRLAPEPGGWDGPEVNGPGEADT